MKIKYKGFTIEIGSHGGTAISTIRDRKGLHWQLDIMQITLRFDEPINLNGHTVYGYYANKPVYNPDFKWPRRWRRPDDVWVDENDMITFA